MNAERKIFGPDRPAVMETVDDAVNCDIAIIGSGMGGGTLAFALRGRGASVLLVECGDFLIVRVTPSSSRSGWVSTPTLTSVEQP
jgi:choline dehydrogenase-like flavoprotein